MEQPPGEQCEKRIGDSSDPTIPEWIGGGGIDSGGHNECDERIKPQRLYHNALKSYVNAMTDAEEIAAVQYGMDLPEPYAAALSEKMAVAQAQMEAIMQKLGGAA